MKPPYRIDYCNPEDPHPIRRGDAWTVEPFVIRSPAGEGSAFWDGLVVRAHLRDSIDGALLHTFDLDEEVTEEDGVGILTLQLQIEPEDSADLVPGVKIGDIEVSCDLFQNRTLVAFRVPCIGDVSHD